MVKCGEIGMKTLHEENCIKNELEIKYANTKNTKLISRVRTTIRTLTLQSNSNLGKKNNEIVRFIVSQGVNNKVTHFQ